MSSKFLKLRNYQAERRILARASVVKGLMKYAKHQTQHNKIYLGRCCIRFQYAFKDQAADKFSFILSQLRFMLSDLDGKSILESLESFDRLIAIYNDYRKNK